MITEKEIVAINPKNPEWELDKIITQAAEATGKWKYRGIHELDRWEFDDTIIGSWRYAEAFYIETQHSVYDVVGYLINTSDNKLVYYGMTSRGSRSDKMFALVSNDDSAITFWINELSNLHYNHKDTHYHLNCTPTVSGENTVSFTEKIGNGRGRKSTRQDIDKKTASWSILKIEQISEASTEAIPVDEIMKTDHYKMIIDFGFVDISTERQRKNKTFFFALPLNAATDDNYLQKKDGHYWPYFSVVASGYIRKTEMNGQGVPITRINGPITAKDWENAFTILYTAIDKWLLDNNIAPTHPSYRGRRLSHDLGLH